MPNNDFYGTLGVPRSATQEEIKKAYRQLAHKHHPDKTQGDKASEEKFKGINEAYKTLKDPQKRQQYDQFGSSGMGGGFGGGQQGQGFNGDISDLFGDVFGDFFGGGGGRSRGGPQRGSDLRYDFDISFEDAAFGTEKDLKIPRMTPCSPCDGSGAKAGTSVETCSTCQGAGQVRFQQGLFSIQRPCSHCEGRGSVIPDPCTTCHGSGRVESLTDVRVKIPAGVDSGSRLRITGHGEYGERGGTPGDLYVVLEVAPHPIFKRENTDIICEVPIGFTQAALGAELEVPTLEGPAKIKIPSGTQTGKVLTLKSKGIVSLQTGRRGHQYVVVTIETPQKLTDRQKELLTEFADLSGEDTMPNNKSFFDKVKEIFE